MPKLNPKKIKSALKAAGWLVVCGAILVFVGVAVVNIDRHHRSDTANTMKLHAGSSHYTLDVASTEVEQEKGLGDRLVMDTDKGMIFPFFGDNQRCFWMKDMHFPLDIIWVDSDKKVTHIQPNLYPGSYPQQYCATAQYVIELNAGEAAKNHMSVGQTLNF
jgi:uncharacterized membrane protein (UPF0127 family)